MHSMFNTRGITSQATMLDHVAQVSSNEMMAEVRDILMNPPSSNQYSTLKSELIRRTQTSQHKHLRRLLTEECGDRTPS